MRERFADLVCPTKHESFFDENEIIVSKTDPQGHITYANDIFLRVAGMTEEEALGSPHCIIRHPDMPRGVFKLLWDTVQDKREIFAFVKNMAKNGDYYWVFAHITPTFDANGKVIAYHSSRRKPTKAQIDKVEPLYASLLEIERNYKNPKEAAAASVAAVEALLKEKGLSYDEFVFTL